MHGARTTASSSHRQNQLQDFERARCGCSLSSRNTGWLCWMAVQDTSCPVSRRAPLSGACGRRPRPCTIRRMTSHSAARSHQL